MSKLFFMCVTAIYVLILGLIYFKNIADEEKRMKEFYNANNQLLINKMKEVYNDKMETDRTNEELRQAIARDKTSSFNWYQDISNTAPIISLKRLHKDRNKIR